MIAFFDRMQINSDSPIAPLSYCKNGVGVTYN
mgnify:CR=1 FL=1